MSFDLKKIKVNDFKPPAPGINQNGTESFEVWKISLLTQKLIKIKLVITTPISKTVLLILF